MPVGGCQGSTTGWHRSWNIIQFLLRSGYSCPTCDLREFQWPACISKVFSNEHICIESDALGTHAVFSVPNLVESVPETGFVFSS